jgi:D-arginine dehydrogenase
MTTTCDFLIVGGGIAGATAAYQLSAHGKVILLERESALAYHTTGRSAAQFFETYGGPDIIKLNQASLPFFNQPPEDFSESPLLLERGAMFFAREDQLDALERHRIDSESSGATIFPISAEEACTKVPVLRPEYVAGALSEPESTHMDVDAIHQGYLRGARRNGAQVTVNAEVTALEHKDGAWAITSTAGEFSAPWVINAAGAWCDELAALAGIAPVGLVPKRRTAMLIDAPANVDISGWPLTIDIDENLYFKPDSGRILASPADETPVPPCDVQPEELDIAILVDRLQTATTLEVKRIQHRWAGLRSFVPDGCLVIGEEPDRPGFCWLAGQGGYGIQTSPAAGRACANLIVHQQLPQDMHALGLTEMMLSPARIR